MASFPVSTMESSLSPYLHAIIHDAGDGFEMGLVGGSAFHFLKGFCGSPGGARLASGWHAMGVNAPRVAGKFAGWIGLVSALGCAFSLAREKEDSWNNIGAGAAGSGLLAAHRGLGASARSATLGGAVFTVIEGCYIDSNKSDGLDEHQENLRSNNWVALGWSRLQHEYGLRLGSRSSN